MGKKVWSFLLAFVPLTVVNGYCLAASYFERGNLSVNTNLIAIFLVVSLLISVSKLFFDFFVTVVTSRCTGLELDNGGILKMLLNCMVPQWIFTLAGLLISRLLFGNALIYTDLILFAAAHTVYYGCAAVRQMRITGKKIFGFVYGTVALVCWGYAVVTIVNLVAR